VSAWDRTAAPAGADRNARRRGAKLVSESRRQAAAHQPFQLGHLRLGEVVLEPADLGTAHLEALGIIGVAQREPALAEEAPLLQILEIVEGAERDCLGDLALGEILAHQRGNPRQRPTRISAQVLVADHDCARQPGDVAFPGVEVLDQGRQADVAVPHEFPHTNGASVDRMIDEVIDQLLLVRGLAPGELEKPGHRDVAGMAGEKHDRLVAQR
jgi:hypothetical protein